MDDATNLEIIKEEDNKLVISLTRIAQGSLWNGDNFSKNINWHVIIMLNILKTEIR